MGLVKLEGRQAKGLPLKKANKNHQYLPLEVDGRQPSHHGYFSDFLPGSTSVEAALSRDAGSLFASRDSKNGGSVPMSNYPFPA